MRRAEERAELGGDKCAAAVRESCLVNERERALPAPKVLTRRVWRMTVNFKAIALQFVGDPPIDSLHRGALVVSGLYQDPAGAFQPKTRRYLGPLSPTDNLLTNCL